MSLETDGQIYELQKSIDKLNENLSMIAYQLYLSNHRGDLFIMPDATIENFLADFKTANLKNIQKEHQSIKEDMEGLVNVMEEEDVPDYGDRI